MVFYYPLFYNQSMRNGYSILYIDDDNYSIGEFKDDKLNGWGAKVFKDEEGDHILRGYWIDDVINGNGMSITFTDEGAKEEAHFFLDGKPLPLEKAKELLKEHDYEWVPDYNGDYEKRMVKYYGKMNEEGLPTGFGIIDDAGTIYYTYYDLEGYRVGLFFFPMPNGVYAEHLYSPKRTNMSMREWMWIRVAGLFLKPQKILKKYRKNQ